VVSVFAACLALLALVGGAVALYVRRGSAGAVRSAAEANAHALVAVQRALGIDVERAVQRSAVGRGVAGDALVLVYGLGYWPSIAAALSIAAVRDRRGLVRLVWAIAASGLVGLVVLTVFPVAPPRLIGALDDQLSSSSLGPVAHPSGWFNPYAAMPSFHVCWTALAAFGARGCVGSAAWLVPSLMSLAVVTTGNHWVLDVVAGWALAGAAWWAAPRLHCAARAGLARAAHRRAGGDGG
jgi:membrane-associated phospholipid phosphatase